MLAPRPTLRAFLQRARSAIASPSPAKPLSFVVGNEAADLDSLCSAIVLAYVRTHQSPPPAPQTLHIPLANIRRPDFSLRPEFARVLRHVGLTTNDMPSLSEILADDGTLAPELADTEKEESKSPTRWLLVDHNAPTGPLKKVFAHRVVGCLDHHVDEGSVPSDCGGEPRVVDVVGSCATLVCEYARSEWEARIKKSGSAEAIDRQLARLALAPVLVDTAGFTNHHKTTPRDVAIGEFLEATLRRSPGDDDAGTDYDRDAYLGELRELEANLEGMSVRDILRRDYKEWEECGCAMGVSAVVQPLECIISRASSPRAYLDAVRAWGQERELDLVVVSTITKPQGELKRELLIWGITEKGARSARQFEKRSGEWLELSVWGEGELCGGGEAEDGGHVGAGWRRAWNQGNLSQSRKQVAPLLREAVKAALG